MSVVLAWWGVSVVGEQVATRRDTPFEEAIDVPPATTAATIPVATTAPPPVEPDPATAAAITGFLGAATSTTLPADPAPSTAAPPSTSRPRTTTIPTGAPATDPPAGDATTTTATTLPPTATTAAPTSTAPATTPPSATTAPTTATTRATTTTAPPSTTSTTPFPPGWSGDDRGAFEPKERGTSTYTFDCGTVTIRWRNYRVLEVTADLRGDHRSCIEHYQGADLVIRQLPETGETEFVVTYPDGSVDRWVMPPPANWQPPTTTTTTEAEVVDESAAAEVTA
jgi:hypothetical protein